jgi:GNAT superfamily N-acetyltransferase
MAPFAMSLRSDEAGTTMEHATTIRVTQTAEEHLEQLAHHQQVCFPTLAPYEWLRVEHFAAHLRVFPVGQHVALDGQRVVGQSSTFRVSGERVFGPHTFHDIIGAGFFTEHDPQGAWLYGADMSVHPDYRGRGIARQLYETRKTLVRQLGMRGMVAGGMLPGYTAYAAIYSVEAYVAAVVAGRVNDPTLTPQIRSGFVPEGILYDYIDDAAIVAHASLLVWCNPESPAQ